MGIPYDAVVIRHNGFERDIPVGMYKQTGAADTIAIIVKGTVANVNGTVCRSRKVL